MVTLPAYLKLNGIFFLALLFCVPAEGEWGNRCQLLLSLFSRPSVTASKVIASALENRALIERARGGRIWLDYLESLSETDLKARIAPDRWVPIRDELAVTFEFMGNHLQLFESEATSGRLRDKLNLASVQKTLLKSLEAQYRKATAQKRIRRSELLTLARVFSVASTYQLYLRADRVSPLRIYGSTPKEVWQRAKVGASEREIDRRFGITALPLLLSSEIFAKDYLFAEPTGLLLLGASTRFQWVDGIDAIDPAFFLDHDENHVRDRLDPAEQENIPLALRLSRTFPLDRLLRVGMLDALHFLLHLTQKIDALPSPTRRRLAESVVFFLFRELRMAVPVIDFNDTMLKSLCQKLLGPNELLSLHWRLSKQTDLGSILLEEPTLEALRETVQWLGALSF
jgi:hypothetical protein